MPFGETTDRRVFVRSETPQGDRCILVHDHVERKRGSLLGLTATPLAAHHYRKILARCLMFETAPDRFGCLFYLEVKQLITDRVSQLIYRF